MSYPLETAAQSAALDALLSRSLTGVPTSWQVALYDASPLAGGVELSATGGYARQTLAANLTAWPAAVSGLKESVAVPFGTSSAAWSTTATHFVLYDAADSTTRWFFGLLLDEVLVDAAGVAVSAQLSLFWNTEA